jgi:hypothetical protein
VRRSSFPPGRQSLLRSLKPLSVADVVLLVQQFIRSGNLDMARQLCEEAEAHWGLDTALTVTHAMVELGAGQRHVAEVMLDEVLADHPEHLSALYTSAWMNIQRGKPINAKDQLLTLTRVFADYPGALGTLATLLMPGPGYREVLAFLHETLQPRAYLEIGVETGATLQLAQSSSVVVGVDPDLSTLHQQTPVGAARLFSCTSDDFFDRQTERSALNGRPLDLAFINGVRQFECALRDFCNVETWAWPKTVVIMLNVLPILPVVASRERQTKFWAGDTWKALWTLLEYREDLTINVIPTPPSGLAVIRNLDARQAMPESQIAEAIGQFAARRYPEDQDGQFPAHLPLVANAVSGWCEALGIREDLP